MNDPTSPEPSDNAHAAVHEALLPNVTSQSLVALMAQAPLEARWMIIECNADYPEGMRIARAVVRQIVQSVAGDAALARDDADLVNDYVYVKLDQAQLNSVLAMDGANAMNSALARAEPNQTSEALAKTPPPAPHRTLRAIRRVWNSMALKRLTIESIRTVKADAAHSSFMALGEDIVWAVLDSGIDASHPHFKTYDNILNSAPLLPRNFSPTSTADPLTDPDGHGTHVAGIIAGQCDPKGPMVLAAVQSIAEDGTPNEFHLHDVSAIRGMAPKCKILSLRIFDDAGDGDDIAAMQALEYVMELNALRSASARARRESQRRLSSRPPDVWRRAFTAVPNHRPARAKRRRRRVRGRQLRLDSRIDRRKRDGPARPVGCAREHRRPRQRRPRHHRRIDASRETAHVRRVVLFFEGPDGGRTHEARRRGARRAHHLLCDGDRQEESSGISARARRRRYSRFCVCGR